MATLLIPVVFRGPTQGESTIDAPVDTIAACFDVAEEKYPGLRELVIDAQTGGIHRFVKVSLNGVLLDKDPATLETRVSAEDEIEVIAAIAGG